MKSTPGHTRRLEMLQVQHPNTRNPFLSPLTVEKAPSCLDPLAIYFPELRFSRAWFFLNSSLKMRGVGSNLPQGLAGRAKDLFLQYDCCRPRHHRRAQKLWRLKIRELLKIF